MAKYEKKGCQVTILRPLMVYGHDETVMLFTRLATRQPAGARGLDL